MHMFQDYRLSSPELAHAFIDEVVLIKSGGKVLWLAKKMFLERELGETAQYITGHATLNFWSRKNNIPRLYLSYVSSIPTQTVVSKISAIF